MITRLGIVESAGEFVVIEPTTGTEIGRSILYQFARFLAYGFMDCINHCCDKKNEQFIPAYSDNIAYLQGASLATEAFRSFKNQQHSPSARAAVDA